MASETTIPDLDRWGADFEAFHARFADLFQRSEPRERSREYVRALFEGAVRRNGWQLAEALGEDDPRGPQRLLNRASWSAKSARDRLLEFSIEQFADEDGIGVLDETGFVKKGDMSVGVARMYSGTAGRIENCQIGVFLGYVSRRGNVLIDRALYLPVSWTGDPERCRRARIPKAVTFRTKPTIGRRLLAHATRMGLPMRWVTGDEVYGDDPWLREWLSRQPYRWVLAVSAATHAWTTRPEVTEPERAHRPGRPRTRPVVRPASQRADEIVAQWPSTSWARLIVAEGEKGPIQYDWGCQRVVERVDKLPGADRWLVARRSISDPTEIAYYLSDAPPETPLSTLAHVASSRHVIEQLIEEGKDDVGMDQYEVRSWRAWYRFITLCMMAIVWLASVRRKMIGHEETSPIQSGAAEQAAMSPTTEPTPGAPPSSAGTPADPHDAEKKGDLRSHRPAWSRPGRSRRSDASWS